MLISRISACLALCVFIAGCGGGNGAGTTEAETELGDSGTLGPAESIAQAMAESGEGSETTNGETGGVADDSGTIVLSPDNTQIQFIGTHAGDDPNPRTCEFTEFSGTATVDADGRLSAINVEIQTDSVSTFDEKLTNHLMSDEFLDVRAHPTIVFETTGVDTADDGTTLTGNLTLMGTTKEVSFPADVSITDGQLALTGSLTINRTDYGMDQMLERVNDEVQINVTVGEGG